MTMHNPSMLDFIPIPALRDNYIWAVVESMRQQAILVDVGEARPALDFLRQHELGLEAIWITHHHADHIGGVAEICQHFPDVSVLIHPDIAHLLPKSVNIKLVEEGCQLSAFGYPVEVWQVAGHTAEHVAFILHMGDVKHVFIGDTLFAAGCGRVFSGTLEQLFASFTRLNHLPDDTVLYPTHEYTVSNLRFAQHIEPTNTDINQALQHAQALRNDQPPKPTLPTKMLNERLTNPFIRAAAGEPALQLAAKKLNLPTEPLALFRQLRQLKDNFYPIPN